MVAALLCSGCADNNQNNISQEKSYGADARAYIEESQNNTEDDAVNAVQIGGSYTEETSLEKLRSAVVTIIGTNYLPDERITRKELLEEIGLEEDMVQDCLAEKVHQKTTLDQLIIIQTTEDQMEEVEEELNAYREKLLEKYEKQEQSYCKVFASRIEIIDQYICYVQLGADTSHIAESSPLSEEQKEMIISFCQQENERAVDAIEKGILEK